MERLKVKTPFGTLVAEPTSDPNYPGIWVSLVEEKDGEEVEKTLALVETHDYQDGTGSIRLLAYRDLDDDDFTDEKFFFHGKITHER